jgi:hypothetical protein
MPDLLKSKKARDENSFKNNELSCLLRFRKMRQNGKVPDVEQNKPVAAVRARRENDRRAGQRVSVMRTHQGALPPRLRWSMRMRRRIKHEKTFAERLEDEARRFKEAADELPPGTERELLLRRVRQAETAAHMNDWLRSPGLQPPK